tara:strand:- start:855 stop:1118 length:264 start_codon:yes stop_codon:yes gene_type:complete
MLSYVVIGVCILLLLAVVYISAKPIGMGIEARRNINRDSEDEKDIEIINTVDDNTSLSDELIKLNKLKNDGMLTEDEYKKAKQKILS